LVMENHLQFASIQSSESNSSCELTGCCRLFTTVRDALGLTYDVSFELSLFDRLKAGWFVISVTSTPAKIKHAVDASLNVLRSIQGSKINQRELDRVLLPFSLFLSSDMSKDLKVLTLIGYIPFLPLFCSDVSKDLKVFTLIGYHSLYMSFEF
jgi:predicted Zn-dependent peptidase